MWVTACPYRCCADRKQTRKEKKNSHLETFQPLYVYHLVIMSTVANRQRGSRVADRELRGQGGWNDTKVTLWELTELIWHKTLPTVPSLDNSVKGKYYFYWSASLDWQVKLVPGTLAWMVTCDKLFYNEDSSCLLISGMKTCILLSQGRKLLNGKSTYL